MSTRIERWGMELAEAVRREHEQTQELEKTKAEIDQIIGKIRSVPAGVLYDRTSELPLVRPYTPSVGVEDPAVTARLELPEWSY